jgi:DNA topoisomerase-1
VLSPSHLPEDYHLIIAEKPDAARRIASALGRVETVRTREVEYIISRGKEVYVVIWASGHLLTLAPSYTKRDVYPILDVQWVPLASDDRKKNISSRLQSFKTLIEGARKVVIACDYDIEGDTIGYNILRYALNTQTVSAYRAKFSTLTDVELRDAFSKLSLQNEWPMAQAGRTRHYLDYVWGINLSRALMASVTDSTGGYITLSIGRVQGPTLNYLYEREVDIRSFVPVPYWQVIAIVEKDDKTFPANYIISRITKQADAERIKRIEGKVGRVSEVAKTTYTVPPPPAFNLGELQYEAYRVLGLSPTQTLAMAEKLYLQAAISYPRTSSQKLPPTIGYSKILTSLNRRSDYKQYISRLNLVSLHPVQGEKSDPAHPAIYPTGMYPSGARGKQWLLYDLITRRFLATFGGKSVKERTNVTIKCEAYIFNTSYVTTVSPGWTSVYQHLPETSGPRLPSLRKGDAVTIKEVKVVERYEAPEQRYNQSTLLRRMESEAIGTKATRAEVISTLIERGYVANNDMQLTDLGFAIMETAIENSPLIISVTMTKSIENDLERIESSHTDPKTVLVNGVEKLIESLRTLESRRQAVGEKVYKAHISTMRSRNILGKCPKCNDGDLIIIRSKRSGKRFVGCTNYSKGCDVSAPLPQRGGIRPARHICKDCGWPIALVYFFRSRRPWRLCLNPSCPTKSKEEETSQQRS